MRIGAMADMHGYLPDLPPCDLLLLAGDVCPDQDQERWVLGPFRDWLRSVRARRIVMIAGNHDFFFETAGWRENLAPHFASYGLCYLEDSGIEIAGQKIWGSPWVENLPDWAFCASPEEAAERFSLIPEDTDILLSHAPPGSILDRVGERSVGSSALASRLQSLRPRVSFFGHIHECGGEQKDFPDTTFYNVALCDEHMQITREPLLLDFPVTPP